MPEMIKHSRHTASVLSSGADGCSAAATLYCLHPPSTTRLPSHLRRYSSHSRARLRCLGAKGTAMSFRSVNDSANGSTEKVTVLFDFGLAVQEPHIDEKLSAMRASLRSVRRRICSERSA